MSRYLIRRLVQSIPTLFGISLLSFLLVFTAPGDPVKTAILGNPKLKEADRQVLIKQYGLDQSFVTRYITWLTGFNLRSGDQAASLTRPGVECQHVAALNFTLCNNHGGILRGDLGRSISTKEGVWERLVQKTPATLELSLASFLLSLLLGIPLGILSAVWRGSFFDNLMRLITAVTQSIPDFWLGLLLIFFFGVVLGILPINGRCTVTLTGECKDLSDRLLHLILPAFVLSIGSTALFSRLMRTEVLEVLHTDYIRTAQAKGLGTNTIWFVHAFRNALIPLMTVMGPAIFGLLGGSVIVERIFGWPGMGRLTLDAVFQQDYPLVLGSVMFFAVLVILGNLLSDILYGLVDPRVRLG
jgi:peptide/nickel transport system permease protein